MPRFGGVFHACEPARGNRITRPELANGREIVDTATRHATSVQQPGSAHRCPKAGTDDRKGSDQGMNDVAQRAPAGTVPYFSQWESPDRAEEILAGTFALSDDPNWARSGAADKAEYARWADHVCGMACLKMVLAARTGREHPILELARGVTGHGGYVVEDDAIRGLIYAPFVAYLRAAFGLTAQIVTGISAQGIPGVLRAAPYFIASVHPSIRRPDSDPPTRGGHLVLVWGQGDGTLTFHNPSGHDPASREAVTLPITTFDRFFAGRGIAILR